jgi:Tfp pilus assembly PilM family ATPase
MPNEKKSIIGLSVSDTRVRFVEVSSAEGKFVIVAQGEKTLEAGIIKSGRIQNEKSFSSALQEVFSSAGVKDLKNKAVSFCLGSDQIFYHVFESAIADKTVMGFMIKEEFLKNIPCDNEQLGFLFKIISAKEEPENEMGKKSTEKAIAAAYKKDIKEAWEIFFQNQGLNLSCFEFDAYAIFEGMEKDQDQSAIAIIDASTSPTNIFFFMKNKLMYAYSSFRDLHDQGQEEFLQGFKNTILYFEKENSVKLQKIYINGSAERMKALSGALKGSDFGVEAAEAKPRPDFKIDNLYLEPLGAALRCLTDTHYDGFFLRPEAYITEECRISGKEEKPSRRFICFLERTLYLAKGLASTRKKLILQAGLSLLLVILAPFIIFLMFQNGKKPEALTLPANTAEMEKEKALDQAVKIVPEKKLVKIKDIGSALNIRSGAGKTFGVIGKAEPGGEYVLVEEAGEWVKIVFGEKEGWVAKGYAELVNNK